MNKKITTHKKNEVDYNRVAQMIFSGHLMPPLYDSAFTILEFFKIIF